MGFAFKTSSHSGGGSCVEVALSAADEVMVRDTKDPQRRIHLSFSFDEWQDFLRGIKAGEFDFGSG